MEEAVKRWQIDHMMLELSQTIDRLLIVRLKQLCPDDDLSFTNSKRGYRNRAAPSRCEFTTLQDCIQPGIYYSSQEIFQRKPFRIVLGGDDDWLDIMCQFATMRLTRTIIRTRRIVSAAPVWIANFSDASSKVFDAISQERNLWKRKK
jgi:hypothetical protein